MRSDDSQRLGSAGRRSVKYEPRRPIPFPDEFHVTKAEPLGPPGPQSLQARFLGRETGGEGQDAIRPRIASGPLRGGEDPVNEAIPVPAERVSQPTYLENVDSQSHDHVASSRRPADDAPVVY